MLLWVYIHTAQAWKIYLATVGNRTYDLWNTSLLLLSNTRQFLLSSKCWYYLFLTQLTNIFYSLKYYEVSTGLSLHAHYHWLSFWLGYNCKLCVLGKKEKSNLWVCQCSSLWCEWNPYDNQEVEEKMRLLWKLPSPCFWIWAISQSSLSICS